MKFAVGDPVVVTAKGVFNGWRGSVAKVVPNQRHVWLRFDNMGDLWAFNLHEVKRDTAAGDGAGAGGGGGA